MTDLEHPQWQTLYLESARESDPKKLGQRIDAAKSAILLRLRTLEMNEQGHLERLALEDALDGLPLGKNTVLEFSNYTKLTADVVAHQPQLRRFIGPK